MHGTDRLLGSSPRRLLTAWLRQNLAAAHFRLVVDIQLNTRGKFFGTRFKGRELSCTGRDGII